MKRVALFIAFFLLSVSSVISSEPGVFKSQAGEPPAGLYLEIVDYYFYGRIVPENYSLAIGASPYHRKSLLLHCQRLLLNWRNQIDGESL